MKSTDPESFDDAVKLDYALRAAGHAGTLRAIPYVHRSCKPLDTIDFRTNAELGQPDLFNNECEGMCGV